MCVWGGGGLKQFLRNEKKVFYASNISAGWWRTTSPGISWIYWNQQTELGINIQEFFIFLPYLVPCSIGHIFSMHLRIGFNEEMLVDCILAPYKIQTRFFFGPKM
jgi:hypothetical protein